MLILRLSIHRMTRGLNLRGQNASAAPTGLTVAGQPQSLPVFRNLMPCNLITFATASAQPPKRFVASSSRRATAFTVVELLIVIGLIAVILSILLPVMNRARSASRSITCLSNLRQLTVAFHLFAERNEGLLPDPGVTKVSWESALMPFVRPGLFECPADGELFPSLASSYDWRDTPYANTTLAGKNLWGPRRSALVLVFESLPSWHLKNRINAGLLDGSVRDMDYEECLRDIDRANNLPAK